MYALVFTRTNIHDKWSSVSFGELGLKVGREAFLCSCWDLLGPKLAPNPIPVSSHWTELLFIVQSHSSIYSRHQGLCLKWASTGNRKQFYWNLWACKHCSFITFDFNKSPSLYWNTDDSSYAFRPFLCVLYLRIPVASWVGWRLSGRQRSSPFALPPFHTQTEISCLVFGWWCHTSNGSLGWRAVTRVRLCSCSPCCQWTPLRGHMHPKTKTKKTEMHCKRHFGGEMYLLTNGSLKYISLLSSIVNHLFLKPSVC